MKIYRGINDLNDGIEGAFWAKDKNHASLYASNSISYWNGTVEEGAVVTASIKDDAKIASFEVDEYTDVAEQDEKLFDFADSLEDIDIVKLPGWEGCDCFFVINSDAITVEIVEEVTVY